jgi:low affinity Fe/Cu permease
MPTHDDTHKVTSTGTEKVKKGQGGVELEGIESVVSATQENRNQKDSTYTVVDDSIKLRPQDAQDWAMSKFGIKIAKPKSSLSFSKAITLVKDQVDIKVKKYEQAFPEASDKLVLNAAKANKEVLETLPSLEDIYEQALQDQEALKIPVPQQNAQVGTMQDYGFKSPQTDRYNFKKKVPTKEELLSDQKQVLARNKEIVAARYRNVASSQLAREAPNQFSPDMIAQKTQAIGDKFRIFPNDPHSFIDDYLNPGVMIGDLASGVGQIPKNVQDKEYGKAALNLAAPVAIGALASFGAKGNGQFVNNLINPVADAIPFRITPNSAEINQFKDLFKPKEAFVGLNETERQTIRAVRNTGSQLARGVLDTPEKGLTFLNKLKTRADILSDSEFQNLTGFNKSSIDEKIDDLKNASKKKEEEVLGLEDQDDALYDVQYTPEPSLDNYDGPIRSSEETRDFYLNTPSDVYENIGRAADSSFLRRYRGLVDEQRLNDNQLAPPPEILKQRALDKHYLNINKEINLFYLKKH